MANNFSIFDLHIQNKQTSDKKVDIKNVLILNLQK